MNTNTLVLTLALAAVLPAQDREFGDPVYTTLTEVRQDPDAFRQVKVVFTAQFVSLGQISNPFFTRFVPSDFANFYCWGDEQEIWQESEYQDPFGMLFLAKTNPQVRELYNLDLYDRITVTGVIRNTFQGIPWIEVVEFTEAGGSVNTMTLAHMYKGDQFMEQRRWQRAIAEFTKAPGDGTPSTVLRAMHKNLGICFLRIGEVDRAMVHLNTALDMSESSDVELQRLRLVAAEAPSVELDRSVDQAGLKDFERPMWEAFDNARPRPSR